MRTRGEGGVDEGTDEEYTGNKSDGDGAAVNASGHATTRTLCRGIWVLKGRLAHRHPSPVAGRQAHIWAEDFLWRESIPSNCANCGEFE